MDTYSYVGCFPDVWDLFQVLLSRAYVLDVEVVMFTTSTTWIYTLDNENWNGLEMELENSQNMDITENKHN